MSDESTLEERMSAAVESLSEAHQGETEPGADAPEPADAAEPEQAEAVNPPLRRCPPTRTLAWSKP